MNNISLLGRIGNDIELRTTTSGKSIVSFPLAVARAYVNKGEERKTDWLDCVAFGTTAEFINKYFRKGNSIGLTGSVQTENYTDKDGKNRKSVRVYVNNVYFVEKKAEEPDDDDLPF